MGRRRPARRRRDEDGAGGCLWLLGALVLMTLSFLLVVLLAEPTFDRLGPYLDARPWWLRAAAGAGVGVLTSLPALLLVGAWRPVRWLSGFWLFTLGVYHCVVWLPSRHDRTGGGEAQWRSDADVYIPMAIVGFFAGTAACLWLRLPRDASTRRP